MTGRVNVADILKSPPVPVLLSVDIVLGLNSSRNLPASLPRFSGTQINSLFDASEGFVGSLTGLFNTTTADDLFVGLNGKAQLGINKAGFEFSVPLGSASFALKNVKGVGTVGARGWFTTNPFADTPLKDIISPPINLSVTADAGFDTAGAYTVRFGYTDDSDLAGIGTFRKSRSFTLDNTGFGASVSGGITLSTTILGVTGSAYGTASGSFRMSVVDSLDSLSGNGNLAAGLSLAAPGLETIYIDVDVLTFSFTNSGFSFDLPFFDPIDVTW